MNRFLVQVRLGCTTLLIVLMLAVTSPAFSQTTPASVVFTSVNANQNFPQVQVEVKVVDAQNNFVAGLNANQFTLKEDNKDIQIESVTSAVLPLSLRIVFIVDEFVIGSNVPVARNAILAFAENQMREGDSVIVLAAADGRITQTIVPLTTDPQDVIDGINNYNPASTTSTNILQTIKQGLDELATLNENITGINKMVVFSTSINDQIDLNETIAKANNFGFPIHTVLLGGDDAKGALNKLANGTGAGNIILTKDIDDLAVALNPQRDENQYLITYRSKVNQVGEHTLTLTVNNAITNSATFSLDLLQAPQVSITAPSANTQIVRAETIFNQSSEAIQPTEQTIAVEVTFPDGHPRFINQEKTVLVINGKAVGQASAVRDDGTEKVLLEFTWDLRPEQTPGVNNVSIAVEVEDELGLKNTSDILPVTLEYKPFNAFCPELISTYLPAFCTNYSLILPLMSVVIAFIALMIVIIYLRRNPKVQQKVKDGFRNMTMTMMPSRVNNSATMFVDPNKKEKATLIVLEGYATSKQTQFSINETTTIGRSSEHAKLVIQGDKEGSPISRLHCTILEKNGTFEIRDESSANGTHVNDVRLSAGKTQTLKDNDIIELAKVRDGGVKFKIQIPIAKSAERMKTLIMTSTPDELKDKPEDKPPGGYTPTQKL